MPRRSHMWRSHIWIPLLVLILALVPAMSANADHFTQGEVRLDIREAGASEDELTGIVTRNVDFVVTARSLTDAPLADAAVAVNLPHAFTFVSATLGGEDLACTTRTQGAPDVLCDIGDLSGTQTIVVTADSAQRAAGTITGVAYLSWQNADAVFAIDNTILANNTLRLVDSTGEATDRISFEVRNTSSAISQAQNITVEIQLPDPDAEVTATVSSGGANARCEQLEAAGGNVICQDLVVPATGPVTGTPVGSVVTPEITITGLGEDRGVLAEAKGDVTTRAVLQYGPDGAVAQEVFHESASRTGGAQGAQRSFIAYGGAVLNREAIALPATEFTPVGGQVRMSLNDTTNTGHASVEWSEDGVHYQYRVTQFRNLADDLDYFQDGGVNFDTHQHDMTYRPNGPDEIPDLWVQALVYAEGALTVRQPDGTERTFENVGMHGMYRQVALPASELEPFQNWSEKGAVPPRTMTTSYGEPVPPLPTNLTLVDVLFANVPQDGTCPFNGVAGETCNQDLGTFVRLMTFVFNPYVEGFNSSGISLGAESPTEDVVDRFESFDPLADLQSPVRVALEASAKTFATAANEADERASASLVVLGRSDLFADSLAGSGLAAGRGPILFTPSDGLDAHVRAEIGRVLEPGGTVFLLGGPVALTPAVATTLRNDGFTVERIAGATRIETSAAVADVVRRLNPQANEQMLARAYGGADVTQAWADSVSGGAYAADRSIPLILTTTDELHPAARAALDAEARTILLGGTNAISDATQNEADEASGDVVRVSGPTRVETAIEVAKQLFERTAGSAGDEFVISPGFAELGWAYGLAAAPHSALRDAPLLLLAPPVENGGAALTPSLVEYLRSLNYTEANKGYATTSSSVPSDYVALEVLRLLAGQAPDEQPE